MSSDFERYADPLDLAASLAMVEVDSARAKAAISAEKGRGLPAPSLQCVWCQEAIPEGKHFCDPADDDCEQMWVKRQEHHKKLHRKG